MIAVAYALIAVGGLVSLLNWGTLISSLRSRRFASAVPFVGALLLGNGLALLPETRAFAWLALVADYGTLIFVVALPRIALAVWATSRINLLHCFTSHASGCELAIKLFRRHVAVISAEFDPPVPCDEHGALVQSFGLVGKWTPTESGFSVEGYVSDRQLLISRVNDAYATEELNYPSDRRYRYDCLDGLVVRERERG